MNFTGYIQSKRDFRDYRINKESNTNFPKEFSLSPQTILSQGEVNSCVAHATASILERIYHDAFSVGWLYGNRNDDFYSVGMCMPDALKTARKYGCPKKKDFDVNEEAMEIFDKVNANRERLIPLAKPFKIGSYARLYTVEDIKTALMKGIPVIFAITIHEDNMPMDNDFVIQKSSEKIRGGHAMMMYGWNEKGWLIQNSWGKGWGNNGTAILPFDYELEEAYTVSKYEAGTDIVKPKLYWLREIINLFIKLFNSWKGR